MAKSVALVMFVAVLAMASSMVSSHREERNLNRNRNRNLISRTFTVYFQLTLGGPNANVVIVARPNTGPGAFGSLLAGDMPVTSGISVDSPIIGRAQGIAVESSLNATERFVSCSLLFLEGEFKDSTIQIQGLLKSAGGFGELAVTSGTKYFRYAGGFAVVQPAVQNEKGSASRYDITIKFDSQEKEERIY